MNKKSKKYNLYNHKGVLIEENVLALDIRNLSRSLEKATIDNPLGSTIKSKILLNKACKLNLVGFFVEQKNGIEIKALEEFVDKKGKVVHASNIRKDKKYAERNLDARVYMMLKEQFNWWE